VTSGQVGPKLRKRVIICMKYKNLIFGLSMFTAIGTLLYWILVFTGMFPLVEIVPGYIVWFQSFPLADFWIVIRVC